jgi:hypothetical protein
MTDTNTLPRLLFHVTEVSEVSGSPLQVTSNIEVLYGYRDGDELELRRPDGTSVRVRSGLVHVNKNWKVALSEPEKKWPLIFWLGQDLTKADVPVGTEVWMLSEHTSATQSKRRLRFEKIDQGHK